MEQIQTEQERIEMLLRPRYKVTALWPYSDETIGNIYSPLPTERRIFAVAASNGAGGYIIPSDKNRCTSAYYEDYPHLFKRLSWWEDRTPEEMPEYVKLNPENTSGGPEVFKVLAVKKFVDGIGICHTAPPDESNPFEDFLSAHYFLPATAAEYNQYTQPNSRG